MSAPSRVLDRVQQFDPQSRAFGVSPLLSHDSEEPRSYTWNVPVWLDQGWEGACVGFSFAHELAAVPVAVAGVDNAFARSIYHVARRDFDPWPGEDYEGTSILAGAKAVQRLGLIGQYRWAFTLNDALAVVSRHGPAIFGCNWYTGMMEPDGAGLVHPTGVIEGGHAILLRGVSVRRRTVRFRNSWGKGWGVNGDCEMDWDEFDYLRRDYGEICVPLVRSK